MATSTRSPRARGTATRSPTAAATAPAAVATATAPAPQRAPLHTTIRLADQFLTDGTLSCRSIFRFNDVKGGAYAFRLALFMALANASAKEINGFTRDARNAMFGLCKGERKRYYGDAVRAIDNPETGAKAGEPLPKLSFPSTADARAYGDAIRAAMLNLRKAVFGDMG